MNAKQHACLGILAGGGYTFLKYLLDKSNNPNMKFSWDRLVINMGLGLVFASLPDWIEPATNPNHRKFFHSLTTAGLVGYGMFGNHTRDLDDNLKDSVRSIGLSYLFHLAADATTPKSLPIIHPKFI
jgi:membrane-bound metal-dependent hydrolase YbcI (DUF457 family)